MWGGMVKLHLSSCHYSWRQQFCVGLFEFVSIFHFCPAFILLMLLLLLLVVVVVMVGGWGVGEISSVQLSLLLAPTILCPAV